MTDNEKHPIVRGNRPITMYKWLCRSHGAFYESGYRSVAPKSAVKISADSEVKTEWVPVEPGEYAWDDAPSYPKSILPPGSIVELTVDQMNHFQARVVGIANGRVQAVICDMRTSHGSRCGFMHGDRVEFEAYHVHRIIVQGELK